MNEELLKYIDLAIADGTISEKERSVVLKKAVEFGVDADEAEMILEGRLHQVLSHKQKINETPNEERRSFSTSHSTDTKPLKCSNCNAFFESFATHCSYCGYEFTNLSANSSVKVLHQKLMEIESKRVIDNNPFKAFGAMMMKNLSGSHHDEVDMQKMELIRSFPIPNTKEDLLEFFTLALPEATVKIRKFIGITYQEDRTKEAIKKVWLTKCEQIIMKAKFAMTDDPQTQLIIEQYARELNL
jgi:hypothetical protein